MTNSSSALRIALALALGLGLARGAAAQSRTNDDPRAEAKIHVGPVYLTPEVQLRQIGVDTNVFNNAINPKSDFTFTVAPEANVWVPIGRKGMVKTVAGADLVYFQQYGTERSVDPHAQVRGEAYLHRVTLFVENDLLNTRQRPNYEIDVRARRLENTLRVGGELRLSTKFAVEVAGRQSILRFDGDEVLAGSYLEQTLNRDTNGVSATARYQRTPLTTIAVRTETYQDRFISAPLRDGNTLRIQPGVEFRPRALVSGSAYLGYGRFTALHDELPDFRGIVGSARLRFRLPRAATLEFSGDRDLGFSYEQLQPYFVLDGLGFTVRRQIVGRFDAAGSVQRQRYSYRDLILPGEMPSRLRPERQDVTMIYSLSGGYTPKRDVRVGIGVSKMNRDSNTKATAIYEGFRIGSSVTYGF